MGWKTDICVDLPGGRSGQPHRSSSMRDLVCEECWENVFSTSEYQDLCKREPQASKTEELEIIYHTTATAIETAAQHCSWCAFLLDIARYRQRCLSNDVEVEISTNLPRRDGEVSSTSTSELIRSLTLIVDDTTMKIQMLALSIDSDLPPTAKADALPGWLDISFQSIGKHIADCCCQPVRPNPSVQQMPTRLVDLEPGHPNVTARLILAKTDNVPYITLSYCWGTRQRAVTTAGNLKDRLEQLDEGELPRTIRDAFTIGRRLGYRYVWIDALCIVQNSQADKVAEINRMTSIYEHSALTIFAASASHADQGILQQYPALPSASNIPFYDTANSNTMVKLQAACDLGKRDDEPGFARAWMCQEQMLSKRLLMYTSLGVKYRCAGGTKEVAGLGYPQQWHGYVGEKFERANLGVGVPLGMKAWRDVLAAYTLTQTTFAEDRLLALSGIVEKFYDYLQAPYVAGIFVNESLPQQLVWTTIGYVEDMLRYNAPSWSWASHKSAVRYNNLTITYDRFEFVSHTTTLKYPDMPYGPITYADLRVKAQLRKVIHHENIAAADIVTHDKTIFLDEGRQLSCLANIDRKRSIYRKIDWFCLPVLWYEPYDGLETPHVNGLLVSKTASEGVYYRVGEFSMAATEWFDDIEQQDLTLV